MSSVDELKEVAEQLPPEAVDRLLCLARAWKNGPMTADEESVTSCLDVDEARVGSGMFWDDEVEYAPEDREADLDPPMPFEELVRAQRAFLSGVPQTLHDLRDTERGE